MDSAEPERRLHQHSCLDSDALRLVGLTRLIGLIEGAPSIAIGLVDGPIALDHPDLNSSHIRVIPGDAIGRCSDATSVACMHGTFVAGIL